MFGCPAVGAEPDDVAPSGSSCASRMRVGGLDSVRTGVKNDSRRFSVEYRTPNRHPSRLISSSSPVGEWPRVFRRPCRRAGCRPSPGSPVLHHGLAHLVHPRRRTSGEFEVDEDPAAPSGRYTQTDPPHTPQYPPQNLNTHAFDALRESTYARPIGEGRPGWKNVSLTFPLARRNRFWLGMMMSVSSDTLQLLLMPSFRAWRMRPHSVAFELARAWVTTAHGVKPHTHSLCLGSAD